MIARLVALAVLLALPARAAQDAARAPDNPFACQGIYEALTAHNSLGEVEDQLEGMVLRSAARDLERPRRAIDLCVVARVKARLGQADAGEYFDRAIRAAPGEPAYELFAGMYWGGMRGARRPLLEEAERHLYRGLAKLEALTDAGERRPYHDVVEDWLRKQLLVLYQQDGLPLLPWKAYHQRGSGLGAPGLSFSSELRAAQDTRDFFYNSEMRQFTSEAAFAGSDLRAGRAFDPRAAWDLARAPQRFQAENRLRLRHNWLGAIDALYGAYYSPSSQVLSFYDTNAALMNVTVVQYGLGFDRTFSLYPLFDVRLAASYRQGTRKGVVEFQPERVEHFNMFEARPSLSRFVGSGTLTLDGFYVRTDLAEPVGGVRDDHQRRREIRAARLEYALYAPLLLPSLNDGALELRRTAIRGWRFFAGVSEDREDYGLRTIVTRDYNAGTIFGGSERFDLGLRASYSNTITEVIDPNEVRPGIYADPAQAFSGLRATLDPQLRIVNGDATPGVPRALLGFGLDSLSLVLPLQLEYALTGRRDYENVRAGAQLWMKVFATGLGGAAVLVTVGYDYQFFYRLQKGLHLGQVAIRLGWGDL